MGNVAVGSALLQKIEKQLCSSAINADEWLQCAGYRFCFPLFGTLDGFRFTVANGKRNSDCDTDGEDTPDRLDPGCLPGHSECAPANPVAIHSSPLSWIWKD